MKPFQRLRELEAKATPGFWSTKLEYNDTVMELVGPYTTAEGCSGPSTEFNNHDDARLICEMRNQLPKLLAVIDVMQEALENYTGAGTTARDALTKARELAGE